MAAHSPRGSGSAVKPILFSSYGSGRKPVIDAQGKDYTGAVVLYNQQYCTIRDLEMMSDTTNITRSMKRWGIYVYADDSTTKHNIKIINNYIHDVIATVRPWTQFYSGGIIVDPLGWRNTCVDSFIIDSNIIRRIAGCGICYFRSGKYSGPNINDQPLWTYLSTNVKIRNNTIVFTSGDGIVVFGTDNELVEYNKVDSVGYLYADTVTVNHYIPAKGGIWVTRHKDGLVQYNEVSHILYLHEDAPAFDNDLGLKGTTVFQYNYSHDNGGELFNDAANYRVPGTYGWQYLYDCGASGTTGISHALIT